MSRIVIRGDRMRLRSAMSFTVSACLHGGILAWVAFSGGVPAKPALSLYDQEIRPNEHKIVWYRLAEKLPEIAPAEHSRDPRPLRARVKAKQTMVAGAKDDPKPGPLIWVPDVPPVPAPKPIDLPNVVAVAPPKLVRPFVPPPERSVPTPRPSCRNRPAWRRELNTAPLPIEAKGAKPARARSFRRPRCAWHGRRRWNSPRRHRPRPW